MRVTNSMMVNSFLSNLSKNSAQVDNYQNQLSSGHKINRLSDDPIGVINMLGAKSKLNKLDMYSNSISDANSWLSQTESSLTELNSVVKSVYEKAVQAGNGTLSTTDKQAMAKVVEQMRQQVVQIGNTSYGGRYIFGGYNTTTTPFTTDSSGTVLYNGVDLNTASSTVTDALKAQTIQYSTGINIMTDVSVNGVQAMGTGENNLNKILSDFETALNADADSTTLSAFTDKLSGKQQDILSQLADVGGKTNRLDLMTTANSDDESNYTEVLSKAEDVDVAQVTMNLKMAEAVYDASLQVGAMVIQPTLLDFLK
jgi:flagellar hook-associated protein 3 FlgL